ncbi:MAG TPA: hypothetical protein VFJ65_11085 [Solirubrobacterales bacterium]|nr:hypothetical protein [Solirubrobacterales bacterium]
MLSLPADAAPLWLEPSDVFVSRYSTGDPAVAMNGAGEAVAAWADRHSVRVAMKGATGNSWGKSRRLSEGLRPQVAIDGKGDAVAVWEHWEGEKLLLESSFRSAGGQWRAPAILSDNILEGQGKWELVMNPRGDAALTWMQSHREPFFESFINSYSDFARVMPAGSGAWGPAVQLSLTGYVTDSDIALDARGDVLAAWREAFRPGPATPTVQAAFGSASIPDGGWQAPMALSAGAAEIGEELQAAIGVRGGAAVVWTTTPSGCGPMVGTAFAGGSWSTPGEISPPGECALQPKLAVGGRRRALAIWDGIERVSTLQASSGSTSTGHWEQPTQLAVIGPDPTLPSCQDLCPGPPLAFARLAMGPDDTAAVTWSKAGSQTPREREIDAALLLPGATRWRRAASLAVASNAYGPLPVAPRVAVGSRRHAIVVWSANGLIQADELLDQRLLRTARLTRSRFPVVRGGKGSSAKSRGGTRIEFAISAPARLRVTIFRLLPGIRPDLQCIPVPADLQKKNTRRCTRKRLIGVLSNRLQSQGRGNLRFDGSLRGRPLKPGVYEAVLAASRSKSRSEPVALPFKVLPGRR